VLEHGLSRHAVTRHVFVGRRLDKGVTQRDWADSKRLPGLAQGCGVWAGQCDGPYV